MNKNTIVIFFLISILFTSCLTRKEMTYFQPANQKYDTATYSIKEKFVSRIQPGDILNIRVFSLSQEANAMFNVFPTEQAGNTSNELAAPVGFLVAADGTVALPLAGKILVEGLSSGEASDTITKKLNNYLVQPTVSVRITNFKISVLGEVQHPSVYIVANERITLPEALSLAGDLTIYGKRENLLLIREEGGKREFYRVDLTKRDFFDSPYYYLRPNDIIYAEPTTGRILGSSGLLQVAPIIISALTLFVLIIWKG
jgi:polysaccharide biosynthesis/export protein